LPRLRKSCRTKRRSAARPRPPLVSPKARISQAQAAKLIACYAARRPPRNAARAAGVSLNTARRVYRFIRARLFATDYYVDTAFSKDEPGLGPALMQALRARRGIGPEHIPLHAAELINWVEGWPPRLVAGHIRTILALTGPLDDPSELTEPEYERMRAYVLYARIALLHHRLKQFPNPDAARLERIARVKAQLDEFWRAYRAASKRVERQAR